MTYMPRIGLPSATISVTIIPFLSDRLSSGTPQASAKIFRTSGSSTER